MSTDAVALFCAFTEQTDCVATSELGEVGVIASVLLVESVRSCGSVLSANRAPVAEAGAVVQISLR